MKAVLLDLGGTLVGYYDRAGFPAVRDEALAACQRRLAVNGLPVIVNVRTRTQADLEGRESPDHTARPIKDRLA